MTKESSVDEERKRWGLPLPEIGARKINKTDMISSDRLVNESIIDFTELNCASYIEKENIKPPGYALEENMFLSFCRFWLFHELHSVGEKISCPKIERWASELRRERTVKRMPNGLFVDRWHSLQWKPRRWGKTTSISSGFSRWNWFEWRK